MSEIAIRNYTKEEFTDSVAPYDYLWSFHEDEFQMTMMVEKMRVYAESIGVKIFSKMWRAYLDKKKRQNAIAVSGSLTKFVGQPAELCCDGYECIDDMITTVDRLGLIQTVCPHPILPIRRLVNIDTGEVKTEIAYARGGRWRSNVYARSILASPQAILQLADDGVAVNSENARLLVAYLGDMEAINYDALVETRSVSRLGWVDGGVFSPYCDDVIYDGEGDVRPMFEAVHPHGSFEAWRETVDKARRDDLIFRMYLAASFASPLVKLTGTLPFVVHLWGGSEAGKTVALLGAASVWGDPRSPFVMSFNSTSVGHEIAASVCNSLPLCLDELQVEKGRGVSYDKTIYALTEGIGRVRGSKRGGIQKTRTWRNCILTSGEMPITRMDSGGGAVNRVVEIDCAGRKLFQDPHGFSVQITEHYGHAGKRWAEWLLDEEHQTEVRETYEDFYRQLTESDATSKQAMAASLILTADRLAGQVVFEDDISLMPDDIVPYLATAEDIDVCARAYSYILDMVASNPVRFNSVDMGNNGELWGKVEGQTVNVVRTVFNRLMENGGYNPDQFLSWAQTRGVIERTGTHRTKTIRINGTPTRCVSLKLPSPQMDEVIDKDMPF